MSFAARLAPSLFVLLWATGFIGARYAMPYAEPFTFLTGRFVITFVLLLLIAAAMKSKALAWRDALKAIVAGMLMHGIYLGGVFWAIANGMPAGLSALIVGLQPLITAVLAGPILGERVLPRHWLGLGVGFTGVVIVLWPKLAATAGGVNLPELAACIIAVLGMAAGTIWQKRFGTGVDMVGGTIWQFFGGAVLVAPLALMLETREIVLNSQLVFAMAWLVLVLSIGAIFVLMYLIREGAISKVASLFYLVPAVTAVLAWLLFDESLSLVQVAGMAIAAAGVALATTQPRTLARASR